MITTNLLLYIDPGTGSMLFSILLGLFTTLFFVMRAVLIKFKFIVTGKKVTTDTKKYDFVVFCEGPQYINVFLPVLQAFEKKHITIHYFTSVKDDPAFAKNYNYVLPEYIGEGNAAITKLNMLIADICLMTTPGLNVYQLKRSKGVKHYAHVLHAASDATMYRMFGIDYFDSILLSGDYQKKDLLKLEQLRGTPKKEFVTVGCPCLDTLQQKFETAKQTDQPTNFTVLVSPSWGPNALLAKYGTKLLDPLVQAGFTVIVRPHPQSKKSEAGMLEELQAHYKDTAGLEWDFERDNTIAMAKSDSMISDFSGIIFDYIFLRDKPFLYVNADINLDCYDAGDLLELEPPIQAWQFAVLPKIGKEIQEKDFPKIGDIIKEMSDSSAFANARKEAKNTAWMYQGQSGQNIADFMIQKQSEFSKGE
ncbi:MAG: CDP-glycerol--glycerophosphate glycerophosphotransferase [Treponema sp. CETP13]|nr:MAG: CDP-glycerol--glycerophosphate glycerophosphotransferase [Treponema sp. CETP13]